MQVKLAGLDPIPARRMLKSAYDELRRISGKGFCPHRLGFNEGPRTCRR